MEALHSIRVAPSLLWKESISRHGRVWDFNPAMQHRAVLGPYCAPLLNPSMRGCLAQWNGDENRLNCYNILGRRRGTAGANAVASPFLRSDDDEETYIPVRAKLLQDAVGPNKTLLDAQARVCTGPTQTRPLDEAQAVKVLETILQSGPVPIAKVKSLTHYGEPYDGNTRFFRSSLFVAAVRASYGETCLLHGIDWMPPKGGVTEELMLKYLGANTTLTPKEAVRLLEDKGVGFAYISQREARPSLYSLIDLREHIKKRPPIATTEKVQHYIKGSGREAMLASFYHEGYEDPLLKLIRARGVQAGLVIKGEEGALSLTTKDRSVDAVVKGRPLNYVAGFRPLQPVIGDTTKGELTETFALELDAIDYGFAPSSTPRTDKSVAKNVELGMAALRGEKGPAYDRIVLNAAVTDHLLGCEGAETPLIAVERAREAIDSGRALDAILNYIDRSKWPAGTSLPTTD